MAVMRERTLEICVSVCTVCLPAPNKPLSISREQKWSGLPTNYDYWPSFVCEPAQFRSQTHHDFIKV